MIDLYDCGKGQRGRTPYTESNGAKAHEHRGALILDHLKDKHLEKGELRYKKLQSWRVLGCRDREQIVRAFELQLKRKSEAIG